jgi:hypothetical protein
MQYFHLWLRGGKVDTNSDRTIEDRASSPLDWVAIKHYSLDAYHHEEVATCHRGNIYSDVVVCGGILAVVVVASSRNTYNTPTQTACHKSII